MAERKRAVVARALLIIIGVSVDGLLDRQGDLGHAVSVSLWRWPLWTPMPTTVLLVCSLRAASPLPPKLFWDRLLC